MSDVWPTYQGGIEWDFNMLVQPLWNLLFGMGLAIIGILLLLRFLPKTTLWNKLVLSAHVTDNFDLKISSQYVELVGKTGIAVTDLRPTGCVEIENKTYEARVVIGIINRGEQVIVVEARSTQLIVRQA
jgi:membrane-bound serine protease (ClpP class)